MTIDKSEGTSSILSELDIDRTSCEASADPDLLTIPKMGADVGLTLCQPVELASGESHLGLQCSVHGKSKVKM